MQKLFDECRGIYGDKYLKNGDTMIATSSILQRMRKKLEIVRVPDSRVSYEFILNDQHVLFTKSVAYGMNTKRRDKFDTDGICTTIGNATRAVRKFFKDERFQHHVLGLNLANSVHDMAVFIRKNEKVYELVHFDPNELSTSRAMNEFQKSLSTRTTRRGYHPRQGNADGKCSYLAWTELLGFILLGKNPFVTENLLWFDAGNKTYFSSDELISLREQRNAKGRELRRNQNNSSVSKI